MALLYSNLHMIKACMQGILMAHEGKLPSYSAEPWRSGMRKRSSCREQNSRFSLHYQENSLFSGESDGLMSHNQASKRETFDSLTKKVASISHLPVIGPLSADWMEGANVTSGWPRYQERKEALTGHLLLGRIKAHWFLCWSRKVPTLTAYSIWSRCLVCLQIRQRCFQTTDWQRRWS